MNSSPSIVSLSDLDEKRFGIRTAKAPNMKYSDIQYIINFCSVNRVEFLITRCSTLDLDAVHEMEDRGFALMDTLIYFKKEFNKYIINNDKSDIIIRSLMRGEELLVRSIAKDAFRGYSGHYHSDSNLAKEQCDEVYSDWAYNSCLSQKIADTVLIAEFSGEVIGFATMKRNILEEGEGVLFGVSPNFQGKGIYKLLMIGGMNWCVNNKIGTMIVSTQITNVAVQKVWSRLGFEPSHSYYTFHKWF